LVEEDGRYLCIKACSTTPSKSTTDPSKVTCKRCLGFIEKKYHAIIAYPEVKGWRVDFDKTDQCPHCKLKMEPDEGSSEMFEDGSFIVTCAYCNNSYWSIDPKAPEEAEA